MLRAAQRVGPSGVVYAIERNRDALRYLERTMGETDVGNVEPIHADAEALPVRFDRPVIALLTFVLHHADRPTRLLTELSQALPTESRLFVCEHHPDGPMRKDHPLITDSHRIDSTNGSGMSDSKSPVRSTSKTKATPSFVDVLRTTPDRNAPLEGEGHLAH